VQGKQIIVTQAKSTASYALEELAALGLLKPEGSFSDLSTDLLRQAHVL